MTLSNPEYKRGHQPRPGASKEVVSEWRHEQQEGISEVNGERGREEGGGSKHKGLEARECVKSEEAEIQE